jgi:undecaprenyl-phosphate 4-deoxy-4-formamido-L-arabinose transferase
MRETIERAPTPRCFNAGVPAAISVVIPVYNSADTLDELVRRVTAVVEREDRLVEVILIDDGSADRSWETISELVAADDRVRGLNLMRNYGQHNALLAGIRAARFPLVVTLDDDLQNPPEEIPKLLAKLDEGFDVVYGSFTERQFGFWRNVGTSVTKLALRWVIGSDIAWKVSAFRAFRTELREAFASYNAPYVSIDVLLSWGTTRFGSVPVSHNARERGRSSYTFGRLANHALNVMTGFSTRPLRFASLIGLLFTLFGLVVLGVVLVTYAIEGGSVPGFPFLASVIAIFSGAQLLTLGIMGEYLARMHLRVMDRPAFAVREEVGVAAEEEVGSTGR